MKIKYLLIILLNLTTIIVFAQQPENLVPNPSFEIGTHNMGTCATRNTDLTSWSSNPGSWGWDNSPEWHNFVIDFNNDFCGICSTSSTENPFLDSKGISLGKENSTSIGEFIYCELNKNLNINQEYKIRFIGMVGRYKNSINNCSLTVHLTIKSQDWWQNPQTNINMLDIMSASQSNPSYCKPIIFEKVITIQKENLKQLVLQASENFFAFDRVELYDYCTEELIRQNRIYKYQSELEEAGKIKAGSVVNNVALGDVNLLNASTTKYKAEKEVSLTNGFNVDRGADFHAKIAPCGSECSSTDLNLTNEYIICGNNCIQLATNIVARNLQITWTSQTPGYLSYLSSTIILNPIFCPPNTNEIGTYEYEIEIRNECNELSKKKIKIKHFPNNSPNPIINILSSNLNTKPLYPEIKLETDDYLEYLSFDILNCQGALVKNFKFTLENGITPGLPFTFLMSELLDPCECYKIRIRSKNFCNDNIEETILNWNQETSPKNISLSNITVCKNGKRMLCFSAKGVRSVNFNLFNRWGSNVMSLLKSYSTNPYCIEIPSNLSNGTYYYVIEFIGCDGTKQTYTSSVTILNCGEQLVGENDSLGNSNNLTINDSLSLDVLPNPILPESKIFYFIADTGTVSIKLLDRNFELVTMLQDNAHKNPGHYELPLSTANLANGLYYCLVEFNGKRFLKTYKLILKN